jgi:hypothetical protein
MGQTYVQLPQATHFCGLIFIAFPFRKKHKPARGLNRWRGLESFHFAHASHFPLLALEGGYSCERLAKIAQNRPRFGIFDGENTNGRPGDGICYRRANAALKRDGE